MQRLQPVPASPLEIGALCKERNITFLVDAVTSLGGIPIEVDNWNIDACYSGTQKCISCPPGLSPVTFSEKAVEELTKRKTSVESWYLDLTLMESLKQGRAHVILLDYGKRMEVGILLQPHIN